MGNLPHTSISGKMMVWLIVEILVCLYQEALHVGTTSPFKPVAGQSKVFHTIAHLCQVLGETVTHRGWSRGCCDYSQESEDRGGLPGVLQIASCRCSNFAQIDC